MSAMNQPTQAILAERLYGELDRKYRSITGR